MGDTAVFDYDPVEFGDHKVMAKALDDRVGCVILTELLKSRYSFDLYGCFTVQEEIGLKGAKAASYAVVPDVAIILEGTTCYDLTGTSEHMMSTRLGDGPSLTVMDRSVISDRDLLKHITRTADKLGIPWQVKRTISGGTDAGRIQVSGKGVRVCPIAVPCRYIHTPVSVMDKRDFFHTLKLAEGTLAELADWLTGDGDTDVKDSARGTAHTTGLDQNQFGRGKVMFKTISAGECLGPSGCEKQVAEVIANMIKDSGRDPLRCHGKSHCCKTGSGKRSCWLPIWMRLV